MASTDFTIADVLVWARTKPADEAYNYQDSFNCALCQFLRDTGRAAKPDVLVWSWRDGNDGDYCNFYKALANALTDDERGKSTFAELVARLEMLCPETVVTTSDWSRLDAYLSDIEAVELV